MPAALAFKVWVILKIASMALLLELSFSRAVKS